MNQRAKKIIMICPAVLAVLLVGVYAYLYVFELPDVGFVYNQHNGVILSVHPDQAGEFLAPGDQIIALNGVSYAEYSMGARPSLLRLIGDRPTLTLDLLRQGQPVTVQLPLVPANLTTRLLRGLEMLPAFILLIFEMIALLFLRPLDTRWVLATLIHDLTAVWLAGLPVQSYNLLASATVARVAVWLCIPMYLHFSWHFPQPLGRLPRPAAALAYLAGAGLAGAEVLRLLPREVFLYGLTFGLVGVVFIVALHRWIKPALRSETRLVALFLAIALLPTMIGALASARLSTYMFSLLITFSLPAGPLVILYAVYHRQLGGLELRTNQAFIVFQYSMLLMALCVGAVALVGPLFRLPGAAPVIAVVLSLSIAVASAVGYPYFARWAEKRMLKMPLLSSQLQHTYAGRITTSLEVERLEQVLVKEVFPALLVRQAALLRLDEALRPQPVALLGLTPADLPSGAEIPSLLQTAGVPYGQAGSARAPLPCGWVRLALSLNVEGRPVGLCLLGRRDPDDFYSMVELPILQSLMDQTALALDNIAQAEQLRKLLQANIERNEAERAYLARELHDDVLGQMALLAMNMPEGLESDQYHQAYQTAANRVRAIVNGLRPTMIAYGLPIALEELAVELAPQSPTPVEIRVALPGSPARYPEEMEVHLYRIIQQACQNAIRHGQASRIEITGTLAAGLIDLHIQDNGCGFDMGEQLDLTGLLARHHYGLAGIFERAALIHAAVRIDSAPGIGTCVSIAWKGEVFHGG